MRKLSILLVLTLVVSAVFVGCGDKAKEDGKAQTPTGMKVTGDVIKIGVFEPTTGENGGGGMQEVLGARYANQLMPTVDINGTTYKIQLEEVDNQSDKSAAVTAAQSLISKGVAAVIGSYGSGVSIAAGSTFASAGVPAVGCSCTNPQVTLGNDFYFRACFLDPFQGTVMASYAKDAGYKTAAVISQNGDDYSTGLAGYFKKSFEELGGTIVADETYQTNESDFNAILTKIKSSNPDCIFIPSSINTATLILPQIAANGIKAQVLAGDTWENAAIISKDAVGVAFSTFFDENDSSNPVAAKFVTGFKGYLNSDPKNITFNANTDTVAAVSALGYDSYTAIYEALKSLDGKEGDITSIAIRDALKGVSFDGVTGHISFDKNGDAIKDTAYIKTVDQDSLTSKEFKFIKTQTVKK
ncbi:ABC transporter substrate-binding protein [Aminipila terrae]|uniref:ABC transporter substrate-binding protein n=1 Tax=Aminipila terrae TaxID=2697030 RepID=A0A6P1MG79_9FIRM|nr:ABC transporter substrate-binding protein [Aminipila terrae]QHI72741.1 ABC transporter substrate-binding protein [Aminipila terrae]